MFLFGCALLDPEKKFLGLFGGIISIADLSIIPVFILTMLFIQNTLAKLATVDDQFYFIFMLVIMSFWIGLSWFVNTISYDGQLVDLFGVSARILFYLFVTRILYLWLVEYGSLCTMIPYCTGILLMGCYNYFSTSFETNQLIPAGITNNTFTSILFPYISFIFAVTAIEYNSRFSALLSICSFLFSFLLYSLSAMIYLALLAPLIIMMACNFIRDNNITFISILCLLGIVIFIAFNENAMFFFFENLSNNIYNKIANIPQLDENNLQSGDQRLALLLSSIIISLDHPIFGVGEYNFREFNLNNYKILGGFFFDHKNPHNSFAELLAWFGWPAFFIFISQMRYFFKKTELLIRCFELPKYFSYLILLFFVSTGLVMDGLYKTTYFYFASAYIFFIAHKGQDSA